MSKLAKALTAAAGNAGGESLYVEDVFSTYLYTGNSSTQTITNGIDLDGEGGLVWIKGRSASYSHYLFDTERGFTAGDDGNFISSNNINAESSTGNFGVSAFNSNGFSLHGSWNGANNSPETFASWTFRKAEKFFDVVTYTGNGANGREISHNLNGDVGMVIVKCTSDSDQWLVWHKSTPTGYLRLDGTGALVTSFAQFKFGNGTTTVNPTSSVFTVAGDSDINGSGRTYVAYLFASDAGGFGDDENIIKCGSYVGNGSTDGPTIDCGFEPQWLLIKNTTNGGNWVLMDAMRGMPVGDEATVLLPNASGAESSYANLWGVDLQANGFKVNVSQIQINESGGTMVYIAIRRPMKTPESGTEVFAIDTAVNYSTNPSGKSFDSGFPVDMFLNKEVDQSYNNALYSRLTNKGLRTNTTDSEFNMGGTNWDSNIAVYQTGSTNTNNYGWMFKRATGFFDVVAYSGTSTIRQQAHNLGVAPEFVIVKGRDFASHWYTYHTGQTGGVDALHSTMRLNLTEASFDTQLWKNYDFNASTFSLDGDNGVNGSAYDYIAYLFATLAGVSKVGSYTGTGSNVDVDCGFSAGARFILIKRTDSSGDWYVWDSSRGIAAGNDPYLLLNSTAAEVTSTDYIDPLASGFTVTSSAPAALNASGGNYIFLAIA